MRDAFWPGTLEAPAPVYPALAGEVRCDFAVVGGGYTGLSAALVLAGAGADVVLVDANRPGWGASGRNGGLVSAGSSKLDDATIRARHGETQARAFFDAERAAVDHVADLLETHGIEADRQSDGYTFAAHSPRAMAGVLAYGESYRARYGLEARVLDRDGMAAAGMASPDLHGGVTVPVGFAINPMKFVTGLTRAAERAGVRIFSDTPVTGLEPGHVLRTPGGAVRARGVLFGLNGYASEATPPGMAARYLPVQSNILVSRVLSEDEIAAQGWWSDQMVVDSRTLLHYFRLLSDRRMLFGLRGSVRATENGFARARAQARADFERMFPAWTGVETPHFWSGLICMTRGLVPFAGALPGLERAFAAFGYHGSGVSMAPYAGALIADMALGRAGRAHPEFMKAAPRRFELGAWRRAVLAPAFAWYRLRDRG